jgi:predicted O-methyltransferase YrrM
MDETAFQPPPNSLEAIIADTRKLGFLGWCWPQVGALLRVMAASKPGGRLLEIGTGTGVEPLGCLTAWTQRHGS